MRDDGHVDSRERGREQHKKSDYITFSILLSN